MFGITSGRYLYDVSLLDPENRPTMQGQQFAGFGLNE